MIIQCAECRKICKDDGWVAPEAFFPAGERVSHGYCPPCAEKAMHEVDLYYANLDHFPIGAAD